jgi:hypothetical protein
VELEQDTSAPPSHRPGPYIRMIKDGIKMRSSEVKAAGKLLRATKLLKQVNCRVSQLEIRHCQTNPKVSLDGKRRGSRCWCGYERRGVRLRAYRDDGFMQGPASFQHCMGIEELRYLLEDSDGRFCCEWWWLNERFVDLNISWQYSATCLRDWLQKEVRYWIH